MSRRFNQKFCTNPRSIRSRYTRSKNAIKNLLFSDQFDHTDLQFGCPKKLTINPNLPGGKGRIFHPDSYSRPVRFNGLFAWVYFVL